MSEQDGTQATIPKRPLTDDPEEWKAYWEAQGQPWRTEPEIDKSRQEELAKRRAIKPNIHKDIYPFRDIKPALTRADIEWLLITHESWLDSIGQTDKPVKHHYRLALLGADLRRLNLEGLPLKNVNFFNACLEDINLNNAHLQEIYFGKASLIKASFRDAHLEATEFMGAHLEGADFFHAYLDRVDLGWSHLEGTVFIGAHIKNSDLRGVFFSNETDLRNVTLYGYIRLVSVHWADVDISAIDWSRIKILGDERFARLWGGKNQEIKEVNPHQSDYRQATRAYRQLATVLRNQGLTEEAARFVYRAQLMQRKVFWYQHKFGQYLFSLFIDLLAGYGYKPWRSFLTYLLVIGIFAATYHQLGAHLAWNEAIVISMTAFHGRGFFPDQFHPGDPQALVAAIEAFVGLLIEVTFIATLTQRLFGK